MNFTEEQILLLAPDESSKKAGKDLAGGAKWITAGSNELALWGECKGSGSKPYQTAVDLSGMAFKCSCPSRKFPCKHGLGLLLYHARQPKSFTESVAPDWVTDWLSKRAEKEGKKEEKAKPVDEAAQAKRALAREQKVQDGIEELLVWIKDIIRNGIITMPEKEYSFWNNMSRRMIDAQASGLAGLVKNLGNLPFYKEGWQSLFLEQLLSIYLVITGYKNSEGLTKEVQADLRQWIGFTYNQDELKQQEGVKDTWLVLGKQVTEEDNLTVERNWLFGLHTGNYALVLQFSFRGQGMTLSFTPGLFIQAELVYFPSAVPLRALIKEHATASPSQPTIKYTGLKEIMKKQTLAYAHFPIQSERVYLIQDVLPVYENNTWWLKDKEDQLAAISETYKNIFTLLAISGGKPLTLAVLGKGSSFEPLGVWHNQTYKPI